MGYGVIGNTKVSGSFVLGSSPGIPANLHLEVAAPSYSGLVLRPLTAATPVQIRLGSPLGKKPGFFGSQAFLFISVSVGRSFRFYGAAVSLSRRRSLRRGTPGHDGFPRALGIMPLRHRYKPVGVTLGKKPGFFGNQAFLFIQRKPDSRFGHDLVTLAMVKSYR